MVSAWKMLWRSARGTSHERSGQPCQDYADCKVVFVGSTPLLIATCADGAGSASHSQIGARLACTAFLNVASAALEDGLRISAIDRQLMLGWYETARARLSFEACISNFESRDFACTLLTAIVSTESATFSQLGDGAIVVDDGEAYSPVFWPQSGEYANTTNFITGADLEDGLEFRLLDRPVKDLAIFTDGLQPLALHYATRTAHSPFFAPMFESLRQVAETESLEGPLRAFLNSEPVNTRTDDDKTIVLATRKSLAHATS
jgi:hypothetical protein